MPLVLGKILGSLERAAFTPESLPPALVSGLALTPAVLAGLLIFHLPAVEMLALGASLGGIVHLAGRRAGWSPSGGPVLAAVVGVALVGPGAPILFTGGVALLGALLELARGRWLPGARLETGLLAYSGFLLAAHGAISDLYLNPASLRPLPEPIRLWLTYGGAPIDPVKLYVGNVPGPVFATSLLAVLVGAAWLWYARRLSLAVVGGFAAGALAVCAVLGWNPGYQLDSGPTWFVAALLLADRRRLPGSLKVRPLLGLAAGLTALGLRTRGVAIEGAVLAVAGVQAALALVEGLAWVLANRRRVWAGLRGLGGMQLQFSNPLRRLRRGTS